MAVPCFRGVAIVAAVAVCCFVQCLGEITVEPLRCYHCSENEDCNVNLGIAAPCRSVYDRCATFYDSATAACVLARGCFSYYSGCYELPTGKVVCICPEDDCNSRLIIPGPNVPPRKCPLDVKTRLREVHNMRLPERPAFAFDEPGYIVPMPAPVGETANNLQRSKRSVGDSPFFDKLDSEEVDLMQEDKSGEVSPDRFEFLEMTRIKPHLSLDPDAGMSNIRQYPLMGRNLEDHIEELRMKGMVDDDPSDGYNPREAYLIQLLRDQGILSPWDKHIIPAEEFDNSEYMARRLKPIFITTILKSMLRDRTKLPIPPNYHARINLLNQHLPQEMIREKTANGTVYPTPPSSFEQYEPMPTPKGFEKVGIDPLPVMPARPLPPLGDSQNGCGGTCPCVYAMIAVIVFTIGSLFFNLAR